MSLKAFHLFFIVASILLALGVGGWGIYIHLQESNLSFLVFGIGSLLVGVLLGIYGLKVFRQFRHL